MVLRIVYKGKTKIFKERKERRKVREQRKEGTIPLQSILVKAPLYRFKGAGKMKKQ